MARYRMSFSCVIDTEKPVDKQEFVAMQIIRECCPHDFCLVGAEKCEMTNCGLCWFNSFKMGVEYGCKSVHVERLD